MIREIFMYRGDNGKTIFDPFLQRVNYRREKLEDNKLMKFSGFNFYIDVVFYQLFLLNGYRFKDTIKAYFC